MYVTTEEAGMQGSSALVDAVKGRPEGLRYTPGVRQVTLFV